MSEVDSATVQILGRQYRFKYPADKLQQLISTATRLDERLTEQAASSPLANRDQLLILTAINLLNELSEQQHSVQQQLQQLLAQLNEAG